jgi:hypothetical protein
VQKDRTCPGHCDSPAQAGAAKRKPEQAKNAEVLMSKITREINLVDVSCEIEYTYYKGCRGARDFLGGRRCGPPLEPDEPAQVEIESITYKGEEMVEHITQDALEHLAIDLLDEIQNDEAA